MALWLSVLSGQVRCLGSRFSISTQFAVPAERKKGPANTTRQGDFPSARQKENEINRGAKLLEIFLRTAHA